MNKAIFIFLIFCALIFTAGQSTAQISIHSSDIVAQFAVGKIMTWSYDTTTTTQVNIGNTGATTWDFSHLRRDSSFVVTSVVPSSTPFTADFPGATHALQAALTLSPLPGVTATGTAYQYFKLDSSWVDFGIKGSGLVNGSIAGTVVFAKKPADTLYYFPLTLGTRWGTSDSAITQIDVVPFYSSRTAKYEASDMVVDAYGPMTIPDSSGVNGVSVHQALRIRETPRTMGGVSYTFVSNDGAFVSFTLTTPGAPDSGTVGIRSITWGGAVVVPPTAIAETPSNVPAEFSLQQNYPNPFNPSTLIQYGLPKGSHVLLDVYNILGQKVATLVNENQEAGYHQLHFSGAGLPSGVYFYRLTAGDFVKTLKMVLTK